jgi:hypothetical protein
MARQFTKGIDLAAHQMKRLARMQATIKQSVQDMQKQGVQDAVELTGGMIKSRQLAAMGHPFARGRGNAGRMRGKLRPLPINVQSGKLRRSMRSRGYKKLGFEVLSSQVPYARFILAEGGTRKMVARGLKKEAQRRLKARQAAHVQYFVRKQRSI